METTAQSRNRKAPALSTRQMSVLLELDHVRRSTRKGASLEDVAAVCGVTVNAIWQTIEILKKKGMVTRERRVARGVEITSKGRRLLRKSKGQN